MKPASQRPSPASLLLEARGESEALAPLDLNEYAKVIVELRGKNLSFGKIAEWLTEKLGRPINKGGVYRVCVEWEDAEQQEAERRAEEAENEPAEEVDYESVRARIVGELSLQLVSVAEAYESDQQCSGFAEDACIRAAEIFLQRRRDEQLANEADTSKPVAGETAESASR